MSFLAGEGSAGKLADAVNESARQVGTSMLTLLVTCSYLLITVATVSHEMLLRESGVRLPLFNIDLPIRRFFEVAPMLVLLLHAHVLVLIEALRRRVARWQLYPGSATVLLYPGAPVQRMTLGRRDRGLRFLFDLIFVTSIVFPYLVFLVIEVQYLPNRSPASFFHAVVVTLDLVLIVLLLWVIPVRNEKASGRPPGRVSRPWPVRLWAVASSVVLIALALAAPWYLLGCDDLRRLQVRDRVLVLAGPSPEVEAALLERGVTREDIHREYSQGLDLSGRDLRRADLRGSKLYRVKLRGADLSHAQLDGADLSGADLNPKGFETWRGAGLPAGPTRWQALGELEGRRTRLVGAHLVGTILIDAEALQADFSAATLDEAHLEGARLSAAVFDGASLRRAGLGAADLVGAKARNADLSEADLSAAVWRQGHLTGSNLTSARLIAADLRGTRMSLTRFHGSDLRAADLGTSMFGADFRRANLWKARFVDGDGAILRAANATGVCLCSWCSDEPVDSPDEGRRTLPDGWWLDLRDLEAPQAPRELPAGGWPKLLALTSPAASLEWLLADGGEAPLSAMAGKTLEQRSLLPACRPATAPEPDYAFLAARLIELACRPDGGAVAKAIANATRRRNDPFQEDLSLALLRRLRETTAGDRRWCETFDRMPARLPDALRSRTEELEEESE
jgi:uncharacterized protein YjbI with pentapeptide repeats